MNLVDASLLGLVEGLTEFLPISSTGHLILASKFLGLGESDADKAFDVVIQAGAIFAVILYYQDFLRKKIASVLRGEAEGRRLFVNLLISFLPAAVVGLAFSKKIKEHLFGTTPVIVAMILGGVVMIALERWFRRQAAAPIVADNGSGANEVPAPKDVTPKQALSVGIAQCAALWPGMSRSMSTILGGRLTGLNSREAAEYSFLLAIPTLLAACAHDLWKERAVLSFAANGPALLVGTLVSFVSAWLVIRFLLNFLKTHSLEVFGWYRVIVGVLLAIFM